MDPKYESNVITVLENGRTTDLSPSELKKLQKFKDDGLPGILRVSDVILASALDLYLDGKMYSDISKILNVKKEFLFYFADKFRWFETKLEHLEVLDNNLKDRILQSKLTNQDFLLRIQEFFKRKIGNKMNRFFATGDEEEASKLNKTDLEMYYKAVDLLDKISGDKNLRDARHTPTIGLNLNEAGLTVKKVGENEIEITPRNKTVGEMIKDLADLKREEDKKVNDIKE